jgi:GNAT superfamily N-acetyltransferase
MLQYIIAGAIGFVVAKLFEDDETPKYEDGGSVNNLDYTGNYRDLRDFINSNNLQDLFVDNYKKYVSELNKDNWEDYTYGELGYDEEIISSIIGKNYKIFYDEENDEFVITKKKLNKISFEIILSTKKYNDRLIKVIEDNGVYTEYKPRYVVLVKENVIGGSTFEIDDNNIYHFDLAIDEEYQGYGIAKKLIDKIVRDAENLKAKQIQAYVVNNVLFEYLKNSGWNVSKDGGEKYAWKQIRTDNFEKGGSVLLAPNGKPSNLTPEQYKLVRSPEFKAWFGDWENDAENASKVVDSNGEPMVVYHGTTMGDFNNFKSYINFFAKDKNIAKNQYSTINSQGQFTNRSKVYEVFLNLRNPYKFDAKNKDYSELRHKFKGEVYDVLDDLSKEIKDNYNTKYDGLIILNIDEEQMFGTFGKKAITDDFISFEPEQIKLADGSNTTFDGNNPDIRYDGGGEITTYTEFYNNLKIEDGSKYIGQKFTDVFPFIAKRKTPNDYRIILKQYYGILKRIEQDNYSTKAMKQTDLNKLKRMKPNLDKQKYLARFYLDSKGIIIKFIK